MLFLIEFDRRIARRVYYEEFEDERRQEAQDARFQRELEANRAHVDHEVVLLDAPSVEALRRTHARYFDDIMVMVDRLSSSTSTYVVRPSEPLMARERKD